MWCILLLWLLIFYKNINIKDQRPSHLKWESWILINFIFYFRIFIGAATLLGDNLLKNIIYAMASLLLIWTFLSPWINYFFLLIYLGGFFILIFYLAVVRFTRENYYFSGWITLIVTVPIFNVVKENFTNRIFLLFPTINGIVIVFSVVFLTMGLVYISIILPSGSTIRGKI